MSTFALQVGTAITDVIGKQASVIPADPDNLRTATIQGGLGEAGIHVNVPGQDPYSARGGFHQAGAAHDTQAPQQAQQTADHAPKGQDFKMEI